MRKIPSNAIWVETYITISFYEA